ncbi:MAG: tRNA pseudouridine(13) synthase TruD [Desulfurococcaceae archaeon]
MLIYPHFLDYVTGLKYTVMDEKLPYEFKLSPETFHVLEVVDLERAGFDKEKGEYAVLRLWKKDVEMLKAVEIVSRRTNVPRSNIYFYGMKDKNAFTVSHLFIRSQLLERERLPLVMDNIRVELIGFIRTRPKRAYFKGNKFRVFIDADTGNKTRLLSLLGEMVRAISQMGLPAYYGYQRFGWKRYNSHVLGKYILLGREDLFAEEFLKSHYPREDYECALKRYLGVYEHLIYENTYRKMPLDRGFKEINAKVNNMFLDAYSSFLFNMLLNTLIEKSGLGSLDTELPMPGCIDGLRYYEPILRVENVEPRLLSKLKCFYRTGLFRPVDNVIRDDHDRVIYEFFLEPGMYAIVILRELFKDGLVLEAG